MENTDKPINEKPKGNMLQNENREDEAAPTDDTGLEALTKMPKEPGDAERTHTELDKDEIEQSKADQ